jgi:glycosyltransferase involved in cell wall biosynthesis
VAAPLRVLHVIPSISPARGGPSLAIRNAMQALHRRGIEMDVATTDDDGDTRRASVPLDRFCTLDGQRVRYFPRQTRRYSMSWPMLRWLKRNVSAYDLVHTHGMFSFAPLAAAWQARAAGVPYIMRPAGVLDSWGLENKSSRFKMLSIRLLEAPLLRDAAAVHFMTELERERAAALDLTIRPVVLPTGFNFDDLGNGQAPADERRAAHELAGDGRPIILYLSRIHPVKRVDCLLRAYASLPQHESAILAIAGDGEAALVGALKQLAQQLKVSDTVRWLGFADNARKRALLAAATIFVLPSASENFGIALLEAMYAGLPVICTRGAGLAGLVRTAGAGIVTDDTVEELRAALERLLGDPALRAEMGRAGRRVVEAELSLDAFGARLENLYRSVQKSGPQRVGSEYVGDASS